MIKKMNNLLVFVLIIILSACSFAASDIKGNSLSKDGFCEVAIGQPLSIDYKHFEKVMVFNESGEDFKLRGRVCGNRVIADIEFNDKIVKKVSLIDSSFCNNQVCIGDSFKKVKNALPNTDVFISGEEGGIISIKDPEGFWYVFNAEEIRIDCYVNPAPCQSEINNVNLVAIVLSQ